MSTFSGSIFYALDELHLVARGIGKQVYDLITVANQPGVKTSSFFYTKPDGTKKILDYPFFVTKKNLKSIGDSITKSRKYIPTSFQGSFDNVIDKIDGTRAVDWMDFLLYIVPTIVVPYLPNTAVKKAVLALVKGCALALQWQLTESLIDEMQR